MGLWRERGATAPAEVGGSEQVRQAGEVRSARIESLRALAALAVVVSHIFGSAHNYGPYVYSSLLHRTLLGGGFAVWLFFGLTGYLLYSAFAKQHFANGGRVDYGRYAFNRVVRILPLYYAVVIVCLILVANGGTAGLWLRYLFLGENFAPSTLGRVDGVVWSLVIEVQFYVLLPFVALGINALARGSLRRAALVIGALGVIGAVIRWVTFNNVKHQTDLVRFNLPATFYFFIPGMLLALAKLAWDRHPPRWVKGPLASATVWLAGSLVLWVLVFDHYNWDLLLGPATFLMIGAIVLPLTPSVFVRALDWKPVAVLGLASYSLYMWHLPIVEHLAAHQMKGDGFAVDLAVMAPLSIVVALISYRVIEEPFLKLRKRWQGAESSRTKT
jgi:peptidoglycan/LPS O-acetylase OafA/YrhL